MNEGPRCESYMTNFKRCLKLATYLEKWPNGVDYLCDHHAKMRLRQDDAVKLIKLERNEKLV